MTETNASTLNLGDEQFNHMMLFLKTPITEKTHLDYRFGDSELRELKPGIWAMPAYLQDDDPFSSFFLFTMIDAEHMVVAFSQGERHDTQLSLSAPITTGQGLNQLYANQEKRAQRVLKFLNDISRADEAEWRQIED